MKIKFLLFDKLYYVNFIEKKIRIGWICSCLLLWINFELKNLFLKNNIIRGYSF